MLLLLRNKHIPHSTLQQNCSRDKYALKGFDWEESSNHYFCLLQNMLMNLKPLGPWCYYLAFKADYFTSHSPIQRCLKLVHKPRCETEKSQDREHLLTSGLVQVCRIWEREQHLAAFRLHSSISYSIVSTHILGWGWWTCSSTHQWQHW